jgi:hypothetical protein
MLSETAVKELAGLAFKADAEWMVNVLPFGSVYWADEMPDIRQLVHCQEQDRKEILQTFSIRLKVWDGKVLSDDETRLWESMRDQVPSWPLFRRLKLTEDHAVARRKAEKQVAQEFEALSDDPDGK